MNIYLKQISGGRSRFTFPSLPESIRVKNGASYQSFSTIGKGAVKIPQGTEITSVSWSGEFFGKAKKREAIVQKWTDPEDCAEILKDWMEAGAVLTLMVTETNINMDVTISSFEEERHGAFGNIRYTIEFAGHRSLLVRTVNELGLGGPAEETKEPLPEDPAGGRMHTVAGGDNLWKIARQYYGGSGSDWTRIYEANIDTIESTAGRYGRADSDRGHYIYPGEVLVIP